MSGAAQEGGLGLFVWPAKKRDQGAAEQIEALTGVILEKVRKKKRAEYLPDLGQDAEVEAFEKQLKEAEKFLKEDLRGRHNKTLQEKAMAAYFSMIRILAALEVDRVGAVYRLLSIASYRDGDTHMATRYFGAYQQLSARPDRLENVYRDVAAFAEEAAENASIALQGSVRILSSPPGAAVRVNGKDVGVAPVTESLTPGLHLVTVSLTGHLPQGRMVEVVSEVESQEELLLRPHPGFNRYERALQSVRKSTGAGKAKQASVSAQELIKLMKADDLLSISVTDRKKKGIHVRGLYASAGEPVRAFDQLLKRDATLLGAFETMLLDGMGLSEPTP